METKEERKGKHIKRTGEKRQEKEKERAAEKKNNVEPMERRMQKKAVSQSIKQDGMAK